MPSMDSSNSFNGPLLMRAGSFQEKPWMLLVAIGATGCMLAAYCLYVLVFRPGNDLARHLYNVLSVAGLGLGLLVAGFALMGLLEKSKGDGDPRNFLLGYGVCGKSLVHAHIPLEADEWAEFRRTHRLSKDSMARACLSISEFPGVISAVEAIVVPDRVNSEEFSVADIVFTLDSEPQRQMRFGDEVISEDLCIALEGKVHWWGSRTSDMKIGLNDRVVEQLSLLGEILKCNTGEGELKRVITFRVNKTGKVKPMLLAGYAGLAAAATVDKLRWRGVEKRIVKGDFAARLHELETKYNWKIQIQQ